MTLRPLRRAEVDQHDDTTAPFLELAREMQREVARVTADVTADPDALGAIFDTMSARERASAARAAFDELPAEQRWAIIERVFDEDVLALALESERDLALADAGRRLARADAAARSRTGDRIDLVQIPSGELLTLSLFRESDVRVATTRGAHAGNCARRVGLQSTADPGTFQVIDDVFNPGGGFFVTAEYDERVWRTTDRLSANALVQPGSIMTTPTDRTLAPVLHLGGRVDFAVDGRLKEGRLHLGSALLGDLDLFADRPA